MYQHEAEQTEEKLNYIDLLNLIGKEDEDAKKISSFMITRGEIYDVVSDKDSHYTADFINLLLCSFNQECALIKVYPANTIDRLQQDYLEKFYLQNEPYAFIPLNLAYDRKEPRNKNHWIALIIDKKNKLIFYLDPAKQSTEKNDSNIVEIEKLREALQYSKNIIFNPIDFQQKEKTEGWIRHCGVYTVEIFLTFKKALDDNKYISGCFLADPRAPESIALETVLSSISCGEAEAIPQLRQEHIDRAKKIISANVEREPDETMISEKTSQESLSHQQYSVPISHKRKHHPDSFMKKVYSEEKTFSKKQKTSQSAAPIQQRTHPLFKAVVAVTKSPLVLTNKTALPNDSGVVSKKRPAEARNSTPPIKRAKPNASVEQFSLTHLSLPQFVAQAKQLAEDIHERYRQFRAYLSAARSTVGVYHLAELYYDMASLFYNFFYRTEGHFNLQAVKKYLEKSIHSFEMLEGVENKLQIVNKANAFLEKIHLSLDKLNKDIISLQKRPRSHIATQLKLLQLYFMSGDLKKIHDCIELLKQHQQAEDISTFLQVHQSLRMLNTVANLEDCLLHLPVNEVNPILIQRVSSSKDAAQIRASWRAQVQHCLPACLCILKFPGDDGNATWTIELKERTQSESRSRILSPFKKGKLTSNAKLSEIFDEWLRREVPINQEWHDEILDVLNHSRIFKATLPLSRREQTRVHYQKLSETYEILKHSPLAKRYRDAKQLYQQKQNNFLAACGLENSQPILVSIPKLPAIKAVPSLESHGAFSLTLFPSAPKIGFSHLNDALTEESWFFEVLPYLDKIPGLIGNFNPIYDIEWWYVESAQDIQRILAEHPKPDISYEKKVVLLYVAEYANSSEGLRGEGLFYLSAQPADQQIPALEGRILKGQSDWELLAHLLRDIQLDDFYRETSGQMQPKAHAQTKIKEKEYALLQEIAPRLYQASKFSIDAPKAGFLKPISRQQYEANQRSQTGILVYDVTHYDDCRLIKNRLLKQKGSTWASIAKVASNHYVALWVEKSSTMDLTTDDAVIQSFSWQISRGTVYFMNSNPAIPCAQVLQWLTGVIGQTEYKLQEIPCAPQRQISNDSLVHAYFNAVAALWASENLEKKEWDFVQKHLVNQQVASASNVERCKAWILNPQDSILSIALDGVESSDVEHAMQQLQNFRERIHVLLLTCLNAMPLEILAKFVEETVAQLSHVYSISELNTFLSSFLGELEVSIRPDIEACQALAIALTLPDEKGTTKTQVSELIELIAATLQQIANNIFAYSLAVTKKFEEFEDKLHHGSLVFSFTSPPLSKRPATLKWSPDLAVAIQSMSQEGMRKSAYDSLIDKLETNLISYTAFSEWHAILHSQCNLLKPVLTDSLNPFALGQMASESWESVTTFMTSFASAAIGAMKFKKVYKKLLYFCYEDLPLDDIQAHLKEAVYPYAATYARSFDDLQTCLQNLFNQAQKAPSIAFRDKLDVVSKEFITELMEKFNDIKSDDERALHYINGYLRPHMMEILGQYMESLYHFRLATNKAMEAFEEALHAYLVENMKMRIMKGGSANNGDATRWEVLFNEFSSSNTYEKQLSCYKTLVQEILRSDTTIPQEYLDELRNCLADTSHSHALYLEQKGLDLHAMLSRFAALEGEIDRFKSLFKKFLREHYDNLTDETFFSEKGVFTEEILSPLKQSVGFEDIQQIIAKDEPLIKLINHCQKFVKAGDDKGSAEISGCLRECLLSEARTYMQDVFDFRKVAKEHFLTFEKILLQVLNQYEVLTNENCRDLLKEKLDSLSFSDYYAKLKNYSALVAELRNLPSGATEKLITEEQCATIQGILTNSSHTHAPYFDHYYHRLQQLLQLYVEICQGEVEIKQRDEDSDDATWSYEVHVFAATLTQAICLIEGKAYKEDKYPLEKSGNEIRIIAAHQLYLDRDLNYPGVNIVLICPTQQLGPEMEKCEIQTSGESGEDKTKALAGQGIDGTTGKGNKGADGIDGLPGKSAGHQLIAANDLSLLERRLMLKADGGCGGKGGDGGDGAKGKDGQDGEDAAEPKITRGLDWTFDLDIKHELICEIGIDGKPGTDGGDAGRAAYGGAGGYAGNIKRISLGASIQKSGKEIIGKHGLRGQNGLPGTPGEGGFHGRDGRDCVLVAKRLSRLLALCGGPYSEYKLSLQQKKGRIKSDRTQKHERDYHHPYKMPEFEEGEEAPRFLSKYRDQSSKSGASVKLKHMLQVDAQCIQPINRHAVFEATEKFFSSYINPQSLDYCPWLTPTLDEFLKELAKELTDYPWRGYALPEPDADYQSLLNLQQQFQSVLQTISTSLAAEKLNTTQLNMGTVALSHEMHGQYQVFAVSHASLYQALQHMIQAVDVNQLSTGLEIRSTRIAKLQSRINQLMNTQRLQQRLAKQQTQTQVLSEASTEIMAESLSKRRNVRFIPNFQGHEKYDPWSNYEWWALSSECRQAMDFLDDNRRLNSKLEPHFLLNIGQKFIDYDVESALKNKDPSLSSFKKLAWAQFFYVYHKQLKQYRQDLAECYAIRLKKQIVELETFQEIYSVIKHAVYRLKKEFTETQNLPQPYPESPRQSYQKLLDLKETESLQKHSIHLFLNILKSEECFSDKQIVDIQKILERFRGYFSTCSPTWEDIGDIRLFNELMQILIDRFEAEGGLLINIMEFQQVLLCITCLDDMALALTALTAHSQPFWLRALLIESCLEKFTGLWRQEINLEHYRTSLMQIDIGLLKLFHNVFCWQYRDQIKQMSTVYPIEMPLYKQLSRKKCEAVIAAMIGIEPSEILLTQLAQASLSIWEDILQEVHFSEQFSLMVERCSIESAENSIIEYCLLALNRIRADLGASYYERFQKWFENVKEKIQSSSKPRTLKPLQSLLVAISAKSLTLKEAEQITEKNYSQWEKVLPVQGINMQCDFSNLSDERDYEEILALIENDVCYMLEPNLINSVRGSVATCKEQITKWEHEIVKGREKVFVHGILQGWRDDELYQQNAEKYIRARVDTVTALLIYAWNITYGQKPRDSQIVALYLFIYSQKNGLLEQVRTGEGKTLIVGLTAAFMALSELAVYIVSSNRDLAKEGERKCRAFYQLLKLESDHLCHQEANQNRQAYAKNIIYDEISSFQQDILESEFNQQNVFGNSQKQKKKCLVVDEVDNMCLDKAAHILYLSHEIESLKWLEPLFLHIWTQVLGLLHSIDQNTVEECSEALAKLINTRITKGDIWAPIYLHSLIKLKIKLWVRSAFRAAMMQENDEFVFDVTKCPNSNTSAFEERSIIVLDKDTGTELYSTQWSDGLPQFLAFKYRHKLSVVSLKAVFISNKTFFQRFGRRLYGLTGTLGSKHSQEFLTQLYGVQFANIPTAQEKRYMQLPSKVAFSQADWLELIVSEAREHLKNRPVLIICENLVVSETLLWQECLRQGIPHHTIKKYTRDGDEIEDDFRKKNASAHDLIIATNKGGRGTDICVDENMDALGGLHVILTYVPANERIEEQAFGRTARNGHCGTGQFIIQADPNKYSDEYQLRLIPAEKLKGQLEKLADVIVEREKIERDNKESARLSEVKQKSIVRLETEEKLFQLFSEFKNFLSEHYWHPFCGIKDIAPQPITESENQETPANVLHEALETMIKDQWAFWLDAKKDALNQIETIEKQQALLNEFEHEFINPIKDALKKEFHLRTILALTTMPEASNRLGRAYMAAAKIAGEEPIKRKNFLKNAKLCFEEAKRQGDISGFSKIAWAYCLIESNREKENEVKIWKIKKRVRHQLKEAIHELEELKRQYMANAQIAQLLVQLNPLEVLQRVSSQENAYYKQVVGKLEVIGLQLHYLKTAAGDYLEPFHFKPSSSPKIYLAENENKLPTKKVYIGKGEHITEVDYATYRDSYLLIKQPQVKLFYITNDSVRHALEVECDPLMSKSTPLEEFMRQFPEVTPLKPIQETLSERDVKKIKSFIAEANPSHQFILFSLEKQGQYFYDLLIKKEILHDLQLKRSALDKSSAQLKEEIIKIITDNLDPSIAGPILSWLHAHATKEKSFSQKDLESLVCSKEELWELMTKKYSKQEVYILDVNLLKKELPVSHQETWNAIKDKLNPCAVNLSIFEGSGAKLAFKEYLLETKLLVCTQRIDLKECKLDDFIMGLHGTKYEKVIVHLKKQHISLKDFLINILNKLKYDDSQYPYLYQNFMPFDTKENEAAKVILFLKTQRILKAGGLVKAYKYGNDKKELLKNNLQTMIKECIVLNFYQSRIEENLLIAQGSIRGTEVGLKASLKHFFELNMQQDAPQQLPFFAGLGLDTFLILNEDSSWWDWRAFAVAMLGLAQVVVGAVLVASGVGLWFGEVLISEGIGDMLYATIAGFAGTFSWREWGMQKTISFAFSMIGSYGLNRIAQAKHAEKAIKAGHEIAMLRSMLEAHSVGTFIRIGSVASAFKTALLTATIEFIKQAGTHYITEWAIQTIVQQLINTIVENIESATIKKLHNHLKDLLLLEFASSAEDINTFLAELNNEIQYLFKDHTSMQSPLESIASQIAQGVLGTIRQISKQAARSGNSYAKIIANSILTGEIIHLVLKSLSSVLNISTLEKNYKTMIEEAVKKVRNLKESRNAEHSTIERSELEQLINENLDKYNQHIKNHLSHNMEHLVRALKQLLSKCTHTIIEIIQSVEHEKFKKMITELKDHAHKDESNSSPLHAEDCSSTGGSQEPDATQAAIVHGVVDTHASPSLGALPPGYYSHQSVIDSILKYIQFNGANVTHVDALAYRHGRAFVLIHDGMPFEQDPTSTDIVCRYSPSNEPSGVGHVDAFIPGIGAIRIAQENMPGNSCLYQVSVFAEHYLKNENSHMTKEQQIEAAIAAITREAVIARIIDIDKIMKFHDEKPTLRHSPGFKMGAENQQGAIGQVNLLNQPPHQSSSSPSFFHQQQMQRFEVRQRKWRKSEIEEMLKGGHAEIHDGAERNPSELRSGATEQDRKKQDSVFWRPGYYMQRLFSPPKERIEEFALSSLRLFSEPPENILTEVVSYIFNSKEGNNALQELSNLQRQKQNKLLNSRLRNQRELQSLQERLRTLMLENEKQEIRQKIKNVKQELEKLEKSCLSEKVFVTGYFDIEKLGLVQCVHTRESNEFKELPATKAFMKISLFINASQPYITTVYPSSPSSSPVQMNVPGEERIWSIPS
jgi:hypothetical protein